MKVERPTDCGNAPRMQIVTDFVTQWARADEARCSERLADDARWRIRGAADDIPADVYPTSSPDRLVIISVLTHGRLAACDGYLESQDGRLDFSHMFRFASTAKTASIAEIRSYCIQTARG